MSTKRCWNLFKMIKQIRHAVAENSEQFSKTLHALSDRHLIAVPQEQIKVESLESRRQRLRQ